MIQIYAGLKHFSSRQMPTLHQFYHYLVFHLAMNLDFLFHFLIYDLTKLFVLVKLNLDLKTQIILVLLDFNSIEMIIRFSTFPNIPGIFTLGPSINLVVAA